MKNIKIFSLIILLIIVVLTLFYFSNRKIVKVNNTNLITDKIVTAEMLENAIVFKVDNILKDNNDIKLLVILKNNEIVEAKFIDSMENIDFSSILEIGDELYVQGYIENNILYISEIYLNNSIQERMGIN